VKLIFILDECPKYCKTCNGAVCMSCFLDYGVYNDTCQICPGGTSVSSQGICVIPEEPRDVEEEEEDTNRKGK